jgi:hypothetical protein
MRGAGGSWERPLAAVLFTPVGRKLRQERFAAALLVVLLSRSWRPERCMDTTHDAGRLQPSQVVLGAIEPGKRVWLWLVFLLLVYSPAQCVVASSWARSGRRLPMSEACGERAEIWLDRRSNGLSPARPGGMFLEACCAASCNTGAASLQTLTAAASERLAPRKNQRNMASPYASWNCAAQPSETCTMLRQLSVISAGSMCLRLDGKPRHACSVRAFCGGDRQLLPSVADADKALQPIQHSCR